MIVGISRRYASSCNDVDDSYLEGESASLGDCIRQKKRRRSNQLKSTRRVGCQRNDLGNNSAGMDMKETEVEIIDEAEFKSIKMCSASKIGYSRRQESDEGFSAATSWKNVDVVSKKPSASPDFFPEDASHGTNQGLLVKKGNGNEDIDSEGIEIERIEEAEFMNLKTHLMSKRGSSSKEEPNEGYSSVTPGKDLSGVSKKAGSADYCEAFDPGDACHGSGHAWPQKLSSLVQRGSDSEDIDPEDVGIEKIDEAEFQNLKTHFQSKIGRSVKQRLCVASSSKNVNGASKNISSADHSVSFSPKDYCAGFDAFIDDSSPIANRGNIDEPTSCGEIKIKRIDEAEFKNRKSTITAKIGSSTTQGYSAANSRKNANIVKEVPSDNYYGSFSSEDDGRDSDKGQTNKSSSFPEKGNNNEDTDSENLGIEKIDDSEFRNKRTHFVSKIRSSTWQEPDEGHFAATSGKNVRSVTKKISPIGKIDKNKKKKEVSSYARRKKKEDAWNRNLHDDVNYSSSECTSSYSTTESDGDNINTSLQDDEINSYGAKHEMNLGIASRTRSKMGTIKKPAQVGNSSLGLSLNSDSSSSEMESSDNSYGIELLGSRVEACEVQNNILMKVSAKKSEHCSNQEGSSVKHAPNRRHLNLEHNESNSERSTFQKWEFCSRKRQQSDDASSEQTKGGKAHKTCEVLEANEEINGTLGEDANAKEGLKHAPDGRLNLQNSESNCELQTFQKQEFCSTKRRLSDDASSKQTKGGKARKTCEVHQENEEINRTFGEDADAEEGLKHAPNGRHLNLQNNESNCEQPSFQKREFCSRKRRLSDDSSSKQTNGGKAHKTCEAHEEKEEINRTLGEDANAEEDLKERSNSPELTSSKQSHGQNNCDETKGVNEPHPKDQPQAGTRRQKKAASPSPLKDDCNHSDDDDYDEEIHEKIEPTSSDIHGHGKIETVHVTDDKEPTGREQVSSKHYDFCSMLADAVLGREPMLETKESDEEVKQEPPSQTQNTLPLKFRFEDEVPKEVEKTEHEKEVEDLFAELDFNWALEELGPFNYPEVDQENGNSPAQETHHARCAKGKHELILKDDQGLICIFCSHVKLGPKEILPQWVERTYQDSERKRYCGTEQLLEFDGPHLQSSIDNVADFGNRADGTVWSIKPGIRESMYEHQQEGFEFLWKNLAGSINLDELKKNNDPDGVGGCIISHAPGTGKTRLSIVFVETYLKMFPNCRPVIVSPASMLLTWEEEFRKWNVEFPFLNLNNLECLGKENKTALSLLARSKRRNKDIIRMVKICSWSMGGSILGISYNMFEKLTGEKCIKGKTSKKGKTLDDQEQKIRKILLEKPGLVVLDEGHTPRNQRSNIWNALLKLQTEKRVILSGTPFQNNFGELFNTLRIVRPAIAGVLAQEKTFAEMIASRRVSSSRKNNGEHSQSPLFSEVVDRAVDKLKISMAPFVHVHKGTILRQSLPGLRDCVVLLKPSALQKSLIERLEGSASTFEFEHKVALISVHPYLFQHCDSTEEQRIGIDMDAVEASKLNPNEGVKTKFIVELVRLSMLLKEKVLIFSQYIQPLELIKEQLKETFKWIDGKQILQMQGRLEQKQRQILINVFNDMQSEAKIMLASTRCCSEGISLVGASRVVLLDVVWNPSVERQAICRAYRIGQKKFVYTYHLMTSGTTEADKYCRQTEKERLSELVFTSSSNEGNKQKQPSLGIEDRILEEMVGHEKLTEMFEKIINQPKDTDLIQTFGLTS